MKLANWNLERAKTKARRTALREVIDAVAADLWVLTETRADFSPALAYSCSSAGWRDQIAGLDEEADRWAMIHSKFPLEKLDVRDGVRTVAARVHPEDDIPFLVFATVLPWIGSGWRGYPSAEGRAFKEALKLQQQEWIEFRRRFPKDEFFVMGDMNQDLAPAHYYGSKTNKDALRLALDGVGLVAVTAGENDPVRKGSAPYACIDHICMLRESRWEAKQPERWPDSPKPDRMLSDHFGISVELVLK